MPTRRFEVNKEQSVAQIPAGNAGNGNDSHCPTGKFSFNTSITARTLLRFAQDYSGMVKVTKVELFIRMTGGTHTAQGGSARAHVNRCGNGSAGAWNSGGGSENSWVTGASGEVWPGPAMGTSSEGGVTGGGWQSVDITDTYKYLIPSYVTNPDGVPGAGEDNNGIRVMSSDESTTSRSFEFYGQSSSYPPYLLVTYTTNTKPNKPTITSPTNGQRFPAGTTTIPLSFTASDPDGGDTMSRFDWIWGNGPTAGGTTDMSHASGFNVTGHPLTVAGAVDVGHADTLTVTVTDQDGAQSVASNPVTVTVTVPPTVAGQSPGASALADIWNLADLAIWTLGGAHAKPQVKFTYNHPSGVGSKAYRVRLWTDASALLWDSGTVAWAVAAGTQGYVNIPTAIVMGTQYRWSVEVQDNDGNWSATMAPTPFKVRWGQAVYSENITTTASGLKWTNSTPAQGRLQFLYRLLDTVSPEAGATPWQTALPTPPAGGKAWFQVLVRMGVITAGQNPALPDMTLTYTKAAALGPDKWTNNNPVAWATSIDTVRRFGSQSLHIVALTNAANYIFPFRNASGDGIEVVPGVEYTYSAYVRTSRVLGNPVVIGIRNAARTAYIATLTPCTDRAISTADTSGYADGWQRLAGWFKVPDGTTVITPDLWANGLTVGDEVWVDGFMLEEGRVASSWKPGFIGDLAVLDKAGVQIDGQAGGIFRLRGQTGGARDLVTMGPNGLRLGGDTDLSAPSTGSLAVGGTPVSLNTHTHASTFPGYGGAPPVEDMSQAASVAGSAATVSRSDHQHGMSNWATARGAAGAALAGGGNQAYTITWNRSLGDANYTAMVTMRTANDPSGRLLSFCILSKTATSMDIRVMNNSAGTAITPAWDAIAVHD